MSETSREYEEREAAAMAEASKTFKQVVRPIDREYYARLEVIRPYWNSPRYTREKQQAWDWRAAQVKEAHELYIRHVDELMAGGEISEQLDDIWTELSKRITAQFATAEAAA